MSDDKLEKLKHEVAVKEERSRILTEINKANLPRGVWPLIRDIICPPLSTLKKD